MLNYLKQEANKTLTANGAAAYTTTGSACLDLFAVIGALRHRSDQEITDLFLRAYRENKDIAMKLLFYARDIRGGLGERRVFRVILAWLADNDPAAVCKNLKYIAEYGRYDDCLCLMDTACEKSMMDVLIAQFRADREALRTGGSVSLLAKWLPSVNASNAVAVSHAKKIARYFGLREADYRKALAELREHLRIIENHLREKDYSFDYSKQPSKALYKYRRAFYRNDPINYLEFLDNVSSGITTLHADSLMPYEIISPILKNSRMADYEKKALNTTWLSLENFGTDENALAVIDGSGSMYGWGTPVPASVALSLGIYFAERNTGRFKNHFITFSENPRLVEIKGSDIYEKVKCCTAYNEIANTNIQKVFELILDTAIKYSVPKKEMPSRLYIISDMEFDCCTKDSSLTDFEYAKKLYRIAGYKLPEIVFWNVNSSGRQQPVSKNEQGVVLVSGCSPRLFSMVAGGRIDPYAFMLEVVGSKRYEKITA